MHLILCIMRQWIKNRYQWKWLAAAVPFWLFCAGGCKTPDAPEYYGFQDMQMQGVSGGLTTVSATIKLYNPNHYGLQLKQAEVALSINGRPAGHSLLDSTIFIPSRDTFFVPVALQIDLRSLLGNALQLLIQKEASIALDGHVKVKKGMFTFNRPFHYDGKQDLHALLNGVGGF